MMNLGPQTRGELAIWATLSIVCLMLLISIIGWSIDERQINDVSTWSKPMKFNFSFALHTVTLAIFVSLLDTKTRNGVVLRWMLPVVSLAVLVELMYIFLQASRGRASHFNFDTAWEEFFYYQVMGGAAAIVMIGTIVIGVLVAVWGRRTMAPGLQTGIVLGAVVGAIATTVTAGAMASGQVEAATGHWVGGPLSDANGLPFFGWSTVAGDLRVPHFFAAHYLQALPLVGLIADRFRLPGGVFWVYGGLFLAVLVTIITFIQALKGQPFVSQDFLQIVDL